MRKRLWSYFKRSTGTDSIQRESQLPTGQSWKLYDSISDLPLGIFIKCATTGEFSSLIVSGHPDATIIAKAWDNIQTQYFDLLEVEEISHYVELKDRINRAVARITRIAMLVNALYIKHDEQIADILRDEDFNVSLDPGNRDLYDRELTRICSLIKEEEIVISECSEEIEKLNKGGEVNTTHFTRTLLELSRFQGYELKTETTTVETYCLVIKEMQTLAKKN